MGILFRNNGNGNAYFQLCRPLGAKPCIIGSFFVFLKANANLELSDLQKSKANLKKSKDEKVLREIDEQIRQKQNFIEALNQQRL